MHPNMANYSQIRQIRCLGRVLGHDYFANSSFSAFDWFTIKMFIIAIISFFYHEPPVEQNSSSDELFLGQNIFWTPLPDPLSKMFIIPIISFFTSIWAVEQNHSRGERKHGDKANGDQGAVPERLNLNRNRNI